MSRVGLVRIGNSRGIRIPKILLDECRFGDVVELTRVGDKLEMRPLKGPRQGWAAAFQAMAEQGDDKLLDRDSLPSTAWEEREWRW